MSEKKKKKVKVQSIQSDDLFNKYIVIFLVFHYSWLHEEEFDDIQSNFDMTEIEENSNTSFSYHDLEHFLITLTVFPLSFSFINSLLSIMIYSCSCYNI